MPRLPRPVAAAAITTLIVGASAGPALAAGPTPLVQAIEKVQLGTDLNFNENTDTAAGDHQAIKALVANAYAREQAAQLVSHIPAISAQQAGKAEWLSGQREGVREDIELSDAVLDILSGDKTAGQQALNSSTLTAVMNRVNKLTSQADTQLHVTIAPATPTN